MAQDKASVTDRLVAMTGRKDLSEDDRAVAWDALQAINEIREAAGAVVGLYGAEPTYSPRVVDAVRNLGRAISDRRKG